jgi:protein gp37
MNIDPSRLNRGLYWQRAWTLVEGCSPVSPGCDNCWSEKQAAMRCNHPHPKIQERAQSVIGELDADGFSFGFTGQLLLRSDNLDLPLRVRKPAVFIVWNDLFHESVPEDFIHRAYAVMALSPHHAFLLLTKRANRMAAIMPRFLSPVFNCSRVDQYAAAMPPGFTKNQTEYAIARLMGHMNHVWHGVTAENQETANERIPYLLQVPGNKFVSLEPLLGQVDLSMFLPPAINEHMLKPDAKCGHHGQLLNGKACPHCFPNVINAVLLGGETGKQARPMHPDWVRMVHDHCQSTATPFFFKQWGEYGPSTDIPENIYQKGPGFDDQSVWRLGKKKAGRIFQGKTHDNLAWLKP